MKKAGIWLAAVAAAALVGTVLAIGHVRAAGPVVVGDKVPDFALKDVNGKTIKLSSYRGKAVVLNFFASW